MNPIEAVESAFVLAKPPFTGDFDADEPLLKGSPVIAPSLEAKLPGPRFRIEYLEDRAVPPNHVGRANIRVIGFPVMNRRRCSAPDGVMQTNA